MFSPVPDKYRLKENLQYLSSFCLLGSQDLALSLTPLAARVAKIAIM